MTLNFPSSPADQEVYGAYTYDANKGVWNKTPVINLPSQDGQAGKYLTTDGSDASWATVVTDPINDVMKATLFFGGN
jgi:hypothetical protein